MQSATIDKWHYQIGPFLLYLKVINVQDIGMVQCCQRLGFTIKPLAESGFTQMSFQYDFDSLWTIEEDILRLIHFPKAPIRQ